MKTTESKIVEKEKIVAEKLNGRFAMVGFIALSGLSNYWANNTDLFKIISSGFS